MITFRSSGDTLSSANWPMNPRSPPVRRAGRIFRIILRQHREIFALLQPRGVTWPSIREMVEKLRGLKAETVVITDAGNREADSLGARVIRVPSRLAELYTPIPYIVPCQIFAGCLAAQKGLDPDRPRALTKVTRTL